MNIETLKFEICADSVRSVRNSAIAGAHRVELCDNLIEGGTTPSLGMIESALEVDDIRVFVIIRPRGGDFLYSDDEFGVMERDVIRARETGVHGIVSGVLLANGDIDLKRTGRLIELAGGLPFTFHRAIDVCRNPRSALDQLIGLGVHRVLTSGGAPTALEGKEQISDLVKQAGNKITIMPGAGIGPHNICRIIEATGASEYHFSARKAFPSEMQYFNAQVSMSAKGLSDKEIKFSDIETIKMTILSAQNCFHQ